MCTPLPTVATFDHQDDLPSPFTATLDTSFPKGQAMSTWLVNVGGSTTAGQLSILAGQHTVNAVNPALSQRWIYSDANPAASQQTLHNPSVQYLTFNTPADAPSEQQCGRVVLSDIHVSNAGTPADQSGTNLRFPAGCQAVNLSPQEKALEFMLFDLSACVQVDTAPPVPPPPATGSPAPPAPSSPTPSSSPRPRTPSSSCRARCSPIGSRAGCA